MPEAIEIERLLSSIQGVTSARAIVDPEGRPVAIHILCPASFHPKQVVRNVESALSAALSLEIDRRIVSVSRLEPGASGGAGPRPEGSAAESSAEEGAGGRSVPMEGRREAARDVARGGVPASGGRTAAAESRGRSGVLARVPRLLLRGFRSESRAARETTCEIRLGRGEAEFVGIGRGPDTPQGRLQAAADATFSALRGALGEGVVALEGVARVEAHGRSFVLVSALGLTGRQPVPLVGTAAVDRSPEEAAVLACLQATNRWAARPGSED